MATAKEHGESLNAAANRLLAFYAGIDAADLPWAMNEKKVLAFSAILAAAGALDTAQDAIDYFTKPYKFDDLHDAWEQLDQPRPPEPGKNTDRGAWEAFIAHVEDN
ncbi:MAG: hypothetical protein J2P17_01345 [Mycobacterium sp.]|nr:hypothetical protein [Mycobacterium sp.]